MLDEKLLRKDAELVASQLRRRGVHFDTESFQTLEASRKSLDVRLQELQAQRNAASKKVGELIKSGVEIDTAKAQLAGEHQEVDAQLDLVKSEQAGIRGKLNALLMSLPNIAAEEVPDGKDESANVEIHRWGEPTPFDFTPKDHVDLGGQQRLLDFELAAKITGSRFAVMRRDIARLHRALIQFMLDTHVEQHGYQEVHVPFMVNTASMTGTGQLPKFAEDSFSVPISNDEHYYLIPTAEVPVTNIARDDIISDRDTPHLGELPVKFVCHSPCFRSEAGSYGRDTRGMIRQHQFEKVELVQLVPPGDSAAAHEELTSHAEAILQQLELPYRKVILCTGDLGFGSHKTYDLEVWLPGQNAYREISSCSNYVDYQARRMNARWRNPQTGKPELLHTLNGSGLAIGRTLVAVLENYQREDGSIELPVALHNYIGGKTHILEK
ncbi:MAG: serine--tRNA ligase [Pseudomonadota bacterium]